MSYFDDLKRIRKAKTQYEKEELRKLFHLRDYHKAKIKKIDEEIDKIENPKPVFTYRDCI